MNSEDEYCLKWNNHHNILCSVLDALMIKESLVDVILAAEGQQIKGHRLVLCACSQYFEVNMTNLKYMEYIGFKKYSS